MEIFKGDKINFQAFFPCSTGSSDCCHDYKNLYALVNLKLTLNVVMQ